MLVEDNGDDGTLRPYGLLYAVTARMITPVLTPRAGAVDMQEYRHGRVANCPAGRKNDVFLAAGPSFQDGRVSCWMNLLPAWM